MRPVVGHFVEAGIVAPHVVPQFLAAIARSLRLRNSLAVELTLAVLVFGFGWMLWKGGMSLDVSTWCTISTGAGRHLTVAGRWYAHVSIPLFQFLLVRWYFGLFVWLLFRGRVSRLDLRLTPTHPDRAVWGFSAKGRSRSRRSSWRRACSSRRSLPAASSSRERP